MNTLSLFPGHLGHLLPEGGVETGVVAAAVRGEVVETRGKGEAADVEDGDVGEGAGGRQKAGELAVGGGGLGRGVAGEGAREVLGQDLVG